MATKKPAATEKRPGYAMVDGKTRKILKGK